MHNKKPVKQAEKVLSSFVLRLARLPCFMNRFCSPQREGCLLAARGKGVEPEVAPAALVLCSRKATNRLALKRSSSIILPLLPPAYITQSPFIDFSLEPSGVLSADGCRLAAGDLLMPLAALVHLFACGCFNECSPRLEFRAPRWRMLAVQKWKRCQWLLVEPD